MSGPTEHPDVGLVRSALQREPQAVRELVARLTPSVQSRVARVLLQTGGFRGAGLRQEVQDLTQEVFLALFAEGERTLRSWDPAAGASLEGFIGLVAQRLTISILRSRRRSPRPLPAARLQDFQELELGSAGFHAEIEARNAILSLAARLEQQLSPQGMDMFQRLFLWEQGVEEICAATQQRPEAVYQWRSRLRRLVQQLMTEDTGMASAQPQAAPNRAMGNG